MVQTAYQKTRPTTLTTATVEAGGLLQSTKTRSQGRAHARFGGNGASSCNGQNRLVPGDKRHYPRRDPVTGNRQRAGRVQVCDYWLEAGRGT